MRCSYIFFLFTVLLLYFNSTIIDVEAQAIKKFSNDDDQFLKELADFFDTPNKNISKQGKNFIKNFTETWEAGKFTVEHQKKIKNTCNRLLELKYQPYPEFLDYLTTVLNVYNNGKEVKTFDDWQLTLEKLMNAKKVKRIELSNYIEFGKLLLSNNVLYQTNVLTWFSNSQNYSIEFDTIPKVIFPALDLICSIKDDSSIIFNTKGVYYPTINLWMGTGGTVNWLRGGFNSNKVYAELKKYQIYTKVSNFSADSVLFYNTDFFDKPMYGKLEEKLLANVTPEKATYPRFDSYDKRLKINNIFKDVDYEGGFSMYGSQFRGKGDEENKALLIFKRENKIFVVSASKRYLIRKDRINAERAAVTIRWEEDSIYHPSVQFRYDNNKRELTLIRVNEDISKSPFFDSYHKVDIYCETMNWKMDEPKIDLQMVQGASSESEALFESANYFSDFSYVKLQGIDKEHPLRLVKSYSSKVNSRTFSVSGFSKFFGKAPEQAESMLIKLAYMGFLIYDDDKQQVTVKDKLFDYLNSKDKKTDYDVIQFSSVISALPNATISLLNFDMLMRGVSRVFLSDSQNVFIYPYDQELTLMKNRDFTFTGRVHAGLFDFYAKKCLFEYDKFNINMPFIDSLRFAVLDKSKDPDMYGNYPRVTIKSVIEDLSGDILIDYPYNKSGLKSFPDYPIFNSKSESFVYYDKNSIQRGVYKRDKFFYHLEPFTIDSLDNKSTEGILFKGYLASANIFPDINEPLVVRPDFSLGFVRETPPSGYPAYGGKGNYTSKIDLSNKGLKGDGNLKFLNSNSFSDDFTFFPDSVNAIAQNFENEEQSGKVEFPLVKANDVDLHWEPYRDIMYVEKIEKPLELYAEKTLMHGKIILQPGGLTGSGLMQFSDAEIDSKLFKYKRRNFDADTSNFRLRTYDLSELAFSTFNYKAHVDFDNRKGEFVSNGGASKVEFPVNKYICYMDQFEWYMDKEEIALANTSGKYSNLEKLSNSEAVDIDLTGSEFISVHPDQDSLRFFSPKAKYNLKNNIIKAEDVKYIRVADAAIFPDSGNVTILKNAEMIPFNNAQILANTTTKYHSIYNATVKIYTAKKYSASGNYDYVDEDGKKQQLYFHDVKVDTSGQTIAYGNIADSVSFTLSPNFGFMGKIKLEANKEFLFFDGGVKISHNCDKLSRQWLAFKSEINPSNIVIPVDEKPKNLNGVDIANGIFYASDSSDIYTAFLSRKHKPGDADIITASGFMIYDKISKEYRIASKEKLKQDKLPGNLLSLVTNDCYTYGEGKINLANDLGRINFSTYGNISHYIIPDSTTLNVVIIVDFYFNKDAIDLMINDIVKNNTLPGISLSSDVYTKALAEILGTETADKLIAEQNLYGSEIKKYPDKLINTLFFTDVKLKWNPETKSYVSIGDVGLGSSGKTQINKYVKAYIEIQKNRGGDILTIYMEPEPGKWYYFNYTRGLMQAFSSDNQFIKFIEDTKPEDRQLKTEKGQQPYRYSRSTERKVKSFLKKMENSDTKKNYFEEIEEDNIDVNKKPVNKEN